jgi:hypothetical protein
LVPSIKTDPLAWWEVTKLDRLKEVVLRTQILDSVFNIFLGRLCTRRGTFPDAHYLVTAAIVHAPKNVRRTHARARRLLVKLARDKCCNLRSGNEPF